MALNMESQSGYTPEGAGFAPGEPENQELAKVKLQQAIETAESDLEKSLQRLEDSKSDEMIDPVAAQELVDANQKELQALHDEWEEKFGPETSH